MIWTADYKGQFKRGDRRNCYPLTVQDGFSRYLLACRGLTRTTYAECRPVFTRLFQEYGLPEILRTDNGVPFATGALGGIRWQKGWVNVSHVLAGEHVGFEEIDNGEWDVYFGPMKLGPFHERLHRVEDARGRLARKHVNV